jgi:hypothetical protein
VIGKTPEHIVSGFFIFAPEESPLAGTGNRHIAARF